MVTPVNVYWVAPRQFYENTFLPTDPSEKGLGFWPDIPLPQPVSTPFYYGENAIPDRRELNFSALPELFAIDNRLPQNSVSKQNPVAQISRTKSLLKV